MLKKISQIIHNTLAKGLRLPALAIATLLVYQILPYNSWFVERWYSRGIFAGYRYIWDHSVGLLPIALIYMVLLMVAYYLVKSWRSVAGIKDKVLALTLSLVNIASLGVILFYWCWAYNYKRVDFRTLTDIPNAQPYDTFVEDEYRRVTDTLVALRSQLTDQDLSSDTDLSSIRDDLDAFFELLNLPVIGRVKVRKLYPKGSLLHINTAGVYLPFSGEGHIDPGLHPIVHPFTTTHEMAHGYGWTGEDVCNFIAMMAMIKSDDPKYRYSGYFGYWRYLRSQLYRLDPPYFKECYADLPASVQADYRDILAYSDRYPDIMPQLRDLFYDNYLKSHGVSAGIKSYSQMILLAYQWQLREER